MLVIVVSLLLAALTATIPTTYASPIRRSIPRKVLIGYTSGHNNYEFVKKAYSVSRMCFNQGDITDKQFDEKNFVKDMD